MLIVRLEMIYGRYQMKKIIFLFFLVFTISCSIQNKDVTIITGKLVGSDGNPLIKTNIKFGVGDEIKPIALIQKDSGAYGIITDHIGYINIKFSGTNHHSAEVPFLLSKPERIKLNVQLSANEQDKNASIQFMDSSSLSAKYNAVNVWLNENKQKSEMKEVGELIFQRINTEQDTNIKTLLCYSYMNNFFNSPHVDPVKAKQILRIMPPASIVWDMGPNYLMWFYYILPADDHYQLEEYIEKVSHESVYPRVRSEAIAYFLLLAEMEKDSNGIQKYYKRLISECPETMRAREARFKYDVLAPGKKVLSFAVASLDNPEEIYSNKTMLGNTYLIEFWRSTCGHCRGEMPFLHNAYEKFKNDGFEILCLSLDDSPLEVIEFRKGDWKMPWYHAFLEGGFDNEIAQKFGVIGTPTPILVDSEGKIIVTGNALRNGDLIRTLTEYFEK